MEDLKRRLVEVEYILKKLDDKYIQKIPQEIWDYIEENKDKEYVFNYDDNKDLVEQNLNIDTISILTYINMEYLLGEEQRKEMIDFLRKDEAIAEKMKKGKYRTEDLFKNRKYNQTLREDNNTNEVAMTKYKKSFFREILNRIKNFFINATQK